MYEKTKVGCNLPSGYIHLFRFEFNSDGYPESSAIVNHMHACVEFHNVAYPIASKEEIDICAYSSGVLASVSSNTFFYMLTDNYVDIFVQNSNPTMRITLSVKSEDIGKVKLYVMPYNGTPKKQNISDEIGDDNIAFVFDPKMGRKLTMYTQTGTTYKMKINQSSSVVFFNVNTKTISVWNYGELISGDLALSNEAISFNTSTVGQTITYTPASNGTLLLY